jgi:hypothetical protein
MTLFHGSPIALQAVEILHSAELIRRGKTIAFIPDLLENNKGWVIAFVSHVREKGEFGELSRDVARSYRKNFFMICRSGRRTRIELGNAKRLDIRFGLLRIYNPFRSSMCED